MSTDPIAIACRLLRDGAAELKNCHTLAATGHDWTGEPEAKAAYDEHMATADALERVHAKLKVYEDLGDAGSDVQLLRMGYAAARLEIESLRARSAAPAGECPPLPLPKVFQGDALSSNARAGSDYYNADQMRAYADATCAMRAQADSQPVPVVDREAVIRAAVAAMPHTNPMVADDLLGGFTMHTEADDVIAIFEAGRAARASADSVLEDAARWRETLIHVGAANHLGGQHFTLNTLRIVDQMFLLRGSVSQHFTQCIDASRAARSQAKEGQSHE